MRVLNKSEYKLLKTVTQCSQLCLKRSLEKYLKDIYKELIIQDDYTIAIGNIPVVLVAHLDTVFTHSPENVFYDREQSVCWSPDGLGADDRAGIYAILTILRLGYRPHIIFTTDEEIGCRGANKLVRDFKNMPEGLDDMKFIIQLDRNGVKDSVFYNCGNKKFQEFINTFGFETAIGTYSDISALCPPWDIAGVNLSIGYKDEHTEGELLYIDDMYNTIDKVCRILDYIVENSDMEPYDFQRRYTYGKYKWSDTEVKSGSLDDLEICFWCLDIQDKSKLKEVNGQYYCEECYKLIFLPCTECGEPCKYDEYYINESKCKKCAEGHRDNDGSNNNAV